MKAPRCPVCADALQEVSIRCGRCRVPYHQDCWSYSGGCAIYGCRTGGSTLPAAIRDAPEASLVRLGDLAVRNGLVMGAGGLTLVPFLVPNPLPYLVILGASFLLWLTGARLEDYGLDGTTDPEPLSRTRMFLSIGVLFFAPGVWLALVGLQVLLGSLVQRLAGRAFVRRSARADAAVALPKQD